MRPLTAMTVISLAAALVAGCAQKAPATSPPSDPPPAGRDAGSIDKLTPGKCGTIERLHAVGGILLASQPGPDDFAQARRQGVKTILNLRHAGEITDFDERQVVEDQGLTYISLPWNGPAELTDAIFDQARAQLKDSPRPLLMHCASANRVGAVWLPYRVLDAGLSWDEALAEARLVGLRSRDFEDKARDYIRRQRE